MILGAACRMAKSAAYMCAQSIDDGHSVRGVVTADGTA
jgi:hypothetical protein